MTPLELAQRDFGKALKAHSHASVKPNAPAEELLHLLELVKLRKEIVEIIRRAENEPRKAD